MQTKNNKVFAIGDSITPGLFTNAIATGKHAAENIIKFLNNEPLAPVKEKDLIPAKRIKSEYYECYNSNCDNEQNRCMSCGYCRDCGLCKQSCPQNAISRIEKNDGKYDSFNNSTEHNNYGFYAGFEQKLTDRFEDKSGGLSAFGQFGYARNSINAVPYYFGAGLVFKGITKRRKEDSVGIAFGWHQFDRQLHKVENRTAEKVIELFYKIKLTEYLFIQPDIQYIIKPGGNNKNAFAVGLRSIIVF